MEKILIIDWDNYFSRIYFVNKIIKDKTQKDESFENINLIWTINKTLKIINYFNSLINSNKYNDIIFVFDTKTWKDWNKKLLGDIIEKYNIQSEWYKWTRTKRPVFDMYKKIFQNLLFFQWFKINTSDKYEADDVIATLSTQKEKEWYIVNILSKDNDLLQVLSEKIFIVDSIGNEWIDNPITLWKIKLKYLWKWIKINDTNDLILLKCIIWDKSDNIIWIKWVQEKTLAKEMKINWCDIINTKIYLNNKEIIEEYFNVIQLNKYIDADDIKILQIDKDLGKYNSYLNKIKLDFKQ